MFIAMVDCSLLSPLAGGSVTKLIFRMPARWQANTTRPIDS